MRPLRGEGILTLAAHPRRSATYAVRAAYITPRSLALRTGPPGRTWSTLPLVRWVRAARREMIAGAGGAALPDAKAGHAGARRTSQTLGQCPDRVKQS
jgi:hypothetical protein